MTQYLILTADDFGANDFIDQGVVKAIEQQKINCVSAFVTHPDSLDRVAQLHRDYPEIAIGLHFSITSGQPVSGNLLP